MAPVGMYSVETFASLRRPTACDLLCDLLDFVRRRTRHVTGLDVVDLLQTDVDWVTKVVEMAGACRLAGEMVGRFSHLRGVFQLACPLFRAYSSRLEGEN